MVLEDIRLQCGNTVGPAEVVRGWLRETTVYTASIDNSNTFLIIDNANALFPHFLISSFQFPVPPFIPTPPREMRYIRDLAPPPIIAR